MGNRPEGAGLRVSAGADRPEPFGALTLRESWCLQHTGAVFADVVVLLIYTYICMSKCMCAYDYDRIVME